MRVSNVTLLAVALIWVLAAQAQDQPPGRGRPGGPGGPGGFGGGRPVFPLMQALDADSDGVISQKEIENSVAALTALDKNKDGKLTDDELRPNFGGPGGGPPREGAGGRGGGSPEDMVARMLSLDANKDGKLTKDEIPERMQNIITRADADKDGTVTKEELTKMVQEQGAAGGRGGPGGFGGGGGGGGGFGPPNPEAFVERALQFDADKDGKLSKEELAKMAEQFGRGFGGGRPPEGDRPQRPQRPQP